MEEYSNIMASLDEIYTYSTECIDHDDILKAIACEYCYNTITINCNIDSRLWLHIVEPGTTWQIDRVTCEEYYHPKGL